MWAHGMWPEVYSTFGYILMGGSLDHEQITSDPRNRCRSLADHSLIPRTFMTRRLLAVALLTGFAIRDRTLETSAEIGREIDPAFGRSNEIPTTFTGHSLQKRTHALWKLCHSILSQPVPPFANCTNNTCFIRRLSCHGWQC